MTTQRLPAFLEGPRLILRLWTPEDAEAAGRAISESLPELEPFMDWVAYEPMTVDDRRQLFRSWLDQWRRGGDSVLVMLHDGEIVGGTGLHRRGGEDRVEIGYWVRTGHTGRGYATEAARMLTTAAFAIPGVMTVAIHHDVSNTASGRIPERLGYSMAREMTSEIKAPGQTGRELQWEMTAEAWARNGPA